MNNVEKGRNFGFVGSLLTLLGCIPYIGILVYIIGFIFLLVSLYNLSKFYNDKDIFSNYLHGWILGFAGAIITLIFGALLSVGIILTLESKTNEEGVYIVLGLIWIFLFIILYLILIISSHLYRQSFRLLGKYTKVNLFNLAGELIFWGYVGIILFGVGLLVASIGQIILTVAFFSIPQTKDMLPAQPQNNP